MDPSILLIVIAILILLLLSGYFSGSETALTATSRARIHQLEKDGVRRAMIVNELINNRERLIGAILLGNNLVNILASALATSVFIELFGEAGVVYATLIMTTLVLIFAEVLPKTYAISNPDRMAMAVSPVLRIIVKTLAPIVLAVEWIVRKTLNLLGQDIDEAKDVLSPHEEIRGAIDLHHLEGGVKKRDRDMLGGVLDLRDMAVDEVMVHRKNMEMVDIDLPKTEIIDQVLNSQYTRLPFWKGNPENIVGVLHVKNILKLLHEEGNDVNTLSIASHLIEPWFIPETTTLQEQLMAFLNKRQHFALVVDEYGALMGLATLEDILEEIVGEIVDEHDRLVRGVRPQTNGSAHVDGHITVRDLNRAMDWDLPEDEANTIAGLVIHEAQTIPKAGQMFSYYGYRFEILRRHRNQITALRITPPRPKVRAEAS